MNVRTFALLFGIVFVAVGGAGFVPGLVHSAPAHEGMTMTRGYGLLLGLFPINILHNVVHLAFGLWGMASYGSAGAARTYFRGVAIIYGVLTVMGLVPALNTTFGLVPIYGHDVWLHAVLALAGAYFGWVHRDTTATA